MKIEDLKIGDKVTGAKAWRNDALKVTGISSEKVSIDVYGEFDAEVMKSAITFINGQRVEL